MPLVARLRRVFAAQADLHERMWQDHQPWLES
jgi:hypothetical protein